MMEHEVPMIETRIDTLCRVSMTAITASWNRAFADYAHPMSLDEEKPPVTEQRAISPSK